MRLRAAAIVAAGALLLGPACGDDDGREVAEEPERRTDADEEPEERVRLELRRFAGLGALVARPTGSGRHPLVVFVHGAGAAPIFYEDLLRDVALAGHVVVAPAMPGSVDRSDFSALLSLPFQPGRIQDVVDAVTAGPQAIGAVDPERIALMGHSLGAMASLAVGFNSCCQDTRVDAVIAMAGELATFEGGSFVEGLAPLLLVHGDEDETVPFQGSREALRSVGTSAYLFAVLGGDHGAYLGRDAETFGPVRDAVLGFLRATVGGDPSGGLADLRNAGGEPGVRLTTRG
jgi:dipeptidyl aminopeptidase/acylaminoacyl peptidase